MSIFSGIEKMSLVDFDNKVSCTLFTYGCNFKCPFCHNAHLLGNTDVLLWSDIYDFLKKRVGILDAVAITGGEPTLHKELKDYMKQIKDLGYLVKLDSNGSNPEMLKELIDEKLIDYVAMDIKSSVNGYNNICGCNVNMENIKKSIDILKNSGIDYEFRTTLIKEYHSDIDFNEVGVLINGASKMFLQKFTLRDSVPDQDLHEIDIEQATIIQDTLKKYVKEVNLRGY